MSKNPQRTQGKVLYPGILRDCKQSSCYDSFMAHSGSALAQTGSESDIRQAQSRSECSDLSKQLANPVLKHSWGRDLQESTKKSKKHPIPGSLGMANNVRVAGHSGSDLAQTGSESDVREAESRSECSVLSKLSFKTQLGSRSPRIHKEIEKGILRDSKQCA